MATTADADSAHGSIVVRVIGGMAYTATDDPCISAYISTNPDSGQPDRRADPGLDPNRNANPLADGDPVRHQDPVPVVRDSNRAGYLRPAQPDPDADASADEHGNANDVAVRNRDGRGLSYGLPGDLLVGPDDVRGE